MPQPNTGTSPWRHALLAGPLFAATVAVLLLAGCPDPSSIVPFGEPLDEGQTGDGTLEACDLGTVGVETCPGAPSNLDCDALDDPLMSANCAVRVCIDGRWTSRTACPLGQTRGQRPCVGGARYEELCPPNLPGAGTRSGECHLDWQDERPVPMCLPAETCVAGEVRGCEAPCDDPDDGCAEGTRERAVECVLGVWVPLHLCRLDDGTEQAEIPCGPLHTEPDAPRSLVERSEDGESVVVVQACEYEAECPLMRNGEPFEVKLPCGCNGRALQRWGCTDGRLVPLEPCLDVDACLDGERRIERAEDEHGRQAARVQRCRFGRWVGFDQLNPVCFEDCTPDDWACDCIEVEPGLRVRFVEPTTDDGIRNGGEIEVDCGPPEWNRGSCLTCRERTEVADGHDDDCDGRVDEGTPPVTDACATTACAPAGMTPCPAPM